MLRRPGPTVAAALVAVVAAALAAVNAGPAMPPLVPVGDHATYDEGAARAIVLVEPIAHAPWFGAAPAAWVAALAALLTVVFWVAARRAGASAVTTVVAIAALMSRPDLRTAIAAGAAPAIGAALLWAAALVLAGPGRRTAWRGSLLLGAAVAAWPPNVAAVPAAAALVRASAATRVVLVGLVVLVGGAAGLALWAARAATVAHEAVSIADVWSVVTSGEPRGRSPYAWPATTAAALPLSLAVVALGSLGRAAAGPVAVGAAAAGVAALGFPGWRAEIWRAVYWSTWPLVPLGLTWLAAQAPPRRRAWVVAVVGGTLVAGGLSASRRHLDEDEARRFAHVLGETLQAAVGTRPATLVTEDTRLDTAIVAWAGVGWQRVRPVPALVEAARDRGRVVVAGPSARAALETWGFRFRDSARIDQPVPYVVGEVIGRLRCVPLAAPWRELPGLEYTGRLGVHVPAGTGALEIVVVGPPPLTPRLRRLDGRPAGEYGDLPMTLPALPPVLWPGDGQLPDARLAAVRLHLPARPDLGQTAAVTLGQRAPLVAARFTAPADRPDVATVCAAPLPRQPADIAATVPLDDDAYFGSGWHLVERDAAGPFRWTDQRAVTLLPSAAGRRVGLVLTTRAAAGRARVALFVNGWPAGEREVAGPSAEYRWEVPAGVWVEGTNELALEIAPTVRPADRGEGDQRRLGLAVTSLRVVP
ncbi:MAG: hypothetical protein AB7H93_16140 [Vicinamibacterales bacterium]